MCLTRAFGGEVDAERNRLREEILTLSQRNAWTGVERNFVALLALGREGVPMVEWTLGSQAARTEGNLLAALERLQFGVQVGPASDDPSSMYRQALSQSEDLLARYGYAHIVVYETKRVPTLDRPEMPFATEEQNAIHFARARVLETRAFMGLLPVGAYVIGDQTFEVAAAAPMVEVRVGSAPTTGTSPR